MHLVSRVGRFCLLLAAFHVATQNVSAGLDSNSTVFIVLMENQNWSSIKSSTNAPYINNTLLPMASYCAQYYNPPGIHPSEPNYLWLEAGSNFGILHDSTPSADHQSTTNHLVTQLHNAGISWRAYQEDIAGTTCPLSNTGSYAVRHDPFVYFDDVSNTNSTSSAYCIAQVRPYTELAGDLASNTVARYNFLTPDLCDDMHNSCSPLNNQIRQGDTWLSNNIPQLLNSPAYINGGVIFITWDEGVSGDGPIGMILLSPFAKGGGYTNIVHYTHSSTLRTIQKIMGVRPFLGDAANASDLSDLFVPGAIPNADPFALDGKADSTNFLQNAGPMILYAAVRGTVLYVATWSPGSNNNGVNDHFVIVTDQLSPTLQPAFPAWSKTGMNAVVSSKPFLSGESINTYVGWQSTTAATQDYKAPTNSGLMEGTIDLVQAFGPSIMTGTIYLAAAAYSTTNGGKLVSQGPPGNGDGNIDSNEFLAVPIPALLDNNFDGVYDRLDPTIDFLISNTQSAPDGSVSVTWNAEPGRNYQVQFVDSFDLPVTWQDLPGGQTNAGVGQISLSLIDTTAPSGTNRFYRVKLLNP